MSQKIQGKITGEAGGSFTATFTFSSGTQIVFSGNFSDSYMPRFSCANATLTYGSVYQLKETHLVEGVVGKDRFRLGIGNDGGPVIEGVLDEPVMPAYDAAGKGGWSGP